MHRRRLHAPRPSGAREPALRRVRARRAGARPRERRRHEGLADTDRRYLKFGDAFEQRLVTQDRARSLEESMAIGWSLLAELPARELTRLSDAQIAAHLGALA
jgi:vacuolar-type H+-ATPase subunit B/Vma2